MLKSLFVGIAIFAATYSFAHEGHEEPKVKPAPAGGITFGNEKHFFEYVYAKDGGRVFLYTLDAKPAPVAGIDAKGSFEIPRQKGQIEAKVVPDGNSWKINAELPKSHRVTFHFTIKNGNHDDKFKFIAEPKKK